MEKKSASIESLLDNSNKADIIEKIGEVLEREGCKLVLITGVPNERKGLDIEIKQSGLTYLFEQVGFMLEALDIVEHWTGVEDD